jgi:hypothetical protein
MKKLYMVIIPLVTLTAGCSKDFLKSYDKRIVGGTWELYDVNSIGVGGRSSQVFNNGFFTFFDSGELEYTDAQGNVYQGSWDIRREYQAYNDGSTRGLFITAVNFQTQRVLTAYFDEILFTGTNRFKTMIYKAGRTYTFKFKR